jgi:hypothetical protein
MHLQQGVGMKHVVTAVVLILALAFLSCGSNNNLAGNVSGDWTVSLTDSSGTSVSSFMTTLSQSGTVLFGTDLNFTTPTQCLNNSTTGTGGFAVNGTFAANGMLQLIVTSMPSPAGGNITTTLNGTLVNSNTISGTWTEVGTQSGCNGSGNFTMTRSD